MVTVGISKGLVLTLKYYYYKKIILVETTLRQCLHLKVWWGRLNSSLKVTLHLEAVARGSSVKMILSKILRKS